MRDFKRLQEDPPTGVSGAPTGNSYLERSGNSLENSGTWMMHHTYFLVLAFISMLHQLQGCIWLSTKEQWLPSL